MGVCMIEATEIELSMFKYSVASREIGEIVVKFVYEVVRTLVHNNCGSFCFLLN